MAHFLLSSLHHYMDTTGCDHLFCHSAAVIEDFNPRTPCGVRQLNVVAHEELGSASSIKFSVIVLLLLESTIFDLYL